MELLFLDSAFIIALVFRADQNHVASQAIWSRVIRERRSLLTTSFVLDEAVTYLNRRGEHELAVEVGEQLLRSPSTDTIDVTRALVEEGWRFFVKHDDKRFSLTDRISFVVMTSQGVSQALTFDNHFTQAGFQIVRSDERTRRCWKLWRPTQSRRLVCRISRARRKYSLSL